MKKKLGIAIRRNTRTKEIGLFLKIPEDMSLKEFLKNWTIIEKAKKRVKKLQNKV